MKTCFLRAEIRAVKPRHIWVFCPVMAVGRCCHLAAWWKVMMDTAKMGCERSRVEMESNLRPTAYWCIRQMMFIFEWLKFWIHFPYQLLVYDMKCDFYPSEVKFPLLYLKRSTVLKPFPSSQTYELSVFLSHDASQIIFYMNYTMTFYFLEIHLLYFFLYDIFDLCIGDIPGIFPILSPHLISAGTLSSPSFLLQELSSILGRSGGVFPSPRKLGQARRCVEWRKGKLAMEVFIWVQWLFIWGILSKKE